MLTSISFDTLAESAVNKTAFCTDATASKFLKLIQSPDVQFECFP